MSHAKGYGTHPTPGTASSSRLIYKRGSIACCTALFDSLSVFSSCRTSRPASTTLEPISISTLLQSSTWRARSQSVSRKRTGPPVLPSTTDLIASHRATEPQTAAMFNTLKLDRDTSEMQNIRETYDPVSARSSSHQACDRCHEKKVRDCSRSAPEHQVASLD